MATFFSKLGENEIVLAPSVDTPLFGDVAVQLGHRTVYGNGTLDYSRNIMPEVRAAVMEFFTAGTTESKRRAFLEQYEVDVILCPDTTPIDATVISELKGLSWLSCVAETSQGALFRVQL